MEDRRLPALPDRIPGRRSSGGMERPTRSDVPSRETFERMYAGKAPWDIGRPQRTFVEAADRITGTVRDAGCGTGENALDFAGRGHHVLGIDFLEGPIRE